MTSEDVQAMVDLMNQTGGLNSWLSQLIEVGINQRELRWSSMSTDASNPLIASAIREWVHGPPLTSGGATHHLSNNELDLISARAKIEICRRNQLESHCTKFNHTVHPDKYGSHCIMCGKETSDED